MTKRFRPLTFPGILTTVFTVAEGKANRNTTYFGVIETANDTVELTEGGVRTSRKSSGWAGAIFGIGDVEVSTPSGSQKFERVIGSRAFERAVMAQTSYSPEAASNGDASKVSYSDEQLEDFEIVVPPISMIIFNALYEFKYNYPFVRYPNDINYMRNLPADLISGQCIAFYGGPVEKGGAKNPNILADLKAVLKNSNRTRVIAPLPGRARIIGLNDGAQVKWDVNTQTPVNEDSFFMSIQPLKNAQIPTNPAQEAYREILEWCQEFSEHAQKSPEHIAWFEHNGERFKRELEMLAQYPAKVIPVNSDTAIPIPLLEWKASKKEGYDLSQP